MTRLRQWIAAALSTRLSPVTAAWVEATVVAAVLGLGLVVSLGLSVEAEEDTPLLLHPYVTAFAALGISTLIAYALVECLLPPP